MAKRKAVRKPKRKVKQILPKMFDCIFCSHRGTVMIRLSHDEGMGFLECRYCSVTYRAPLNNLTEPTDIYHGWIDSCEDLERSNTAAKSAKEARISLERPSADSSGLENYREEEISRGSVRREEKSF